MHFGRAVLAVATAALAAGCNGSSPGAATPSAGGGPDLAGFLRSPVATPTHCPASVNGTTVGRRSPWVGQVDVSVFVNPRATKRDSRALGSNLRNLPSVARVYVESSQQALEEFRRLYTCSDRIKPGALPASYRLVLDRVTTKQRDDLVRRIYRLPAVSGVSCDPSNPCVDVGPAQ